MVGSSCVKMKCLAQMTILVMDVKTTLQGKNEYKMRLINPIIFLLLTNSLLAQPDTSLVSILPAWELNDSWNYRITKTKKEFTNDQLLVDDSISYTINFKVIDTAYSLYHI